MATADRVLDALRCVECRVDQWSSAQVLLDESELACARAEELVYMSARNGMLRALLLDMEDFGHDPRTMTGSWHSLVIGLEMARRHTKVCDRLLNDGILNYECVFDGSPAPAYITQQLFTIRAGWDAETVVRAVQNLIRVVPIRARFDLDRLVTGLSIVPSPNTAVALRNLQRK
jgi:hypothetical protein